MTTMSGNRLEIFAAAESRDVADRPPPELVGRLDEESQPYDGATVLPLARNG